MNHDVKEQNPYKMIVSIEKANEFLKFIKKSEYKMVNQLNQTPSKIFVFFLLLNSEAHMKSLLKCLNETFVTQDIIVD